MAPPRTATKSNTIAAQSASRHGSNARGQLNEEVDEETQTNCTDVNDEAEDDEPDPSQGTAVQNMIIGSLSNVCRDALTHTLPKRLSNG